MGIEVEKEVLESIEYFRNFKIYYLEIGILEAMWKILKLVPKNHMDIVETGLIAIRNTYHLLQIPEKAYIDAYTIYHNGHRDYIDALYYSVSKNTGIPFLTIDYGFIDFLKKHGYPIDGLVYTPEEIEELLTEKN